VSDDGAEKRFDATPTRRERAKREGNAASSHELAASAAFAGGLAGLVAVWPLLARSAAGAVQAATAASLRADVRGPLFVLALAFVPALAAAVAGTAATLAQTGGLRVRVLRFSLAGLAPRRGLGRMFGPPAAVGAVRATIAFVVVTAIVAPIGVRTVASAGNIASALAAAGIAAAGMLQACIAAAGIGALFAGADYALVRRRWVRSLKMTFDEFKRDAKEADGDPHAKSRRKQLHRALARGGIARVREASFLVVNPTHLAIGLRYAPPTVPVPEIVVRAAGAPALDVRALAERARIPIVEDVALARLLWQRGEAGRPIPPSAFVAVAYAIAALVRAGVLRA